jgi:hypothetical protein
MVIADMPAIFAIEALLTAEGYAGLAGRSIKSQE